MLFGVFFKRREDRMQAIEEWIQQRQLVGKSFRLQKIRTAMEKLNQPHLKFNSIHVTGTNGKGSTVAYLDAIFQVHGLKTGIFVSPHLESYHDRIQINRVPISQKDFNRLATRVQEIEVEIQEEFDVFTYFEIMAAIMFLYFEEQKVDVAIIEVGIGGLLDITNIIESSVSVVTSIGFDHQAMLGNTLEEITIQKTGIFKPNQPVILGPLPKEAEPVVQYVTDAYSNHSYLYGKDFQMTKEKKFVQFDENLSCKKIENLDIPLIGEFQSENAAVAIQAFLVYASMYQLTVHPSKILLGIKETKWGGRMEIIQKSPMICLDGAHNLPAITRLLQTLLPLRTETNKVDVLFAGLMRKDIVEMIHLLKDQLPTNALTLTTFNYDGAATKVFYQTTETLNKLVFVDDPEAFIRQWKDHAQTEDVLFVTGSLYFISEIRHLLLK